MPRQQFHENSRPILRTNTLIGVNPGLEQRNAGVCDLVSARLDLCSRREDAYVTKQVSPTVGER